CFSVAAPLVDLSQPHDTRVAEALARQVRMALKRDHLAPETHVILVDHGSPQPEVTAVRDHLARMLAKALEGEVAGVYPASMERREGAAYAFNDPMLADRLRLPPCNRGKVLVCLQFLAPGRHAGKGGDIEQIGVTAQAENPGLELFYTLPLGDDDRLLTVLAERYAQAVRALNEVDGS
ncbi:MAG TPA: CbiX/SirB N-terminal domain-containing protein, partial [Opitutaceae bacterium]|nr:CbiX/SirB N-terminal domain-containing protein [Opitutaceae bacterium]